MTLRPYQVEAVDRSFAAWGGGLRRIALALPTGAGKTVVFSEIIRKFREEVAEMPVLVLAHRDELLGQAKEKINIWAPNLRTGLVKAASNQVTAPIIIASQQTLVRESRVRQLPRFGLVVVDECHRSMGTSYLTLLERLGCTRPDGPLTLGVTATFCREDSKRLTDFYQGVPFAKDIVDLIMDGYLAAPKFKRVLIEGLDLSGIPMSRREGGKDLAAGELGEAMDRAGAPGVVAAAYLRHAADRSGLVFTPTVASAEHVAQALRDIGITAEMLDGKATPKRRKQVMDDYNAGKIQVVCNAALLGEGVDAPITSCVVIARPTISKTLFRQMVGRGLRLFPDKEDCLVLDVVGATGRNDLKTLGDVTDYVVPIDEDETLEEAVQRAVAAEPREYVPTHVGDGSVSGSLLAVDIDPWEIERRRGRKKNGAGEPMTDEELERLEIERAEAAAQADHDRELRLKRRYKPVEMRSGWFLRTPRDRWFIQITTANKKQDGVVVIVELGGGRHAVGFKMMGVDVAPVTENEIFPDADAATRYAIALTLGIVQEAAERSQVDPDASWRRKPASQGQISYADSLVGNVDFEEYHYAGQVSDFITFALWHRKVDFFADSITAQANQSATLAIAQ